MLITSNSPPRMPTASTMALTVKVHALPKRAAPGELTGQPVHFERQFGKSKYGAKRLLNGMFDLMTVMFITRRSTTPLHLFGRIAFFFFAVGGLINLYFLVQWIMGQGLHVRPLMVLGLIMIVIAIQIGSIGLVAELYSSTLERTFWSNEMLPYYP